MVKQKVDISIQFMSYSEIATLSSVDKIKKIIKIILDNKLIILQGRLKPEEETKLIENTMVLIDTIKGFKGVEIATLSNNNEKTLFEKIRHNIAKILVGEQDTVTLIGPASIVKEIRKDPKRIELILKR